MFQSDGVVENLHKVWSNLNPGNVNDDRIGWVTGFGRSGIVDGDDPEPIHDAVPGKPEDVFVANFKGNRVYSKSRYICGLLSAKFKPALIVDYGPNLYI